jgi:hypothetical protein
VVKIFLGKEEETVRLTKGKVKKKVERKGGRQDEKG